VLRPPAGVPAGRAAAGPAAGQGRAEGFSGPFRRDRKITAHSRAGYGMIVAMKRLLSTAAFLAGLASVPAMAACPDRVSVGYGVTLSSVARACGVSAASLRLANPGLGDGTLRAGAIINVPRQRYSTPRTGSGRSSLRLAP